MSALAEVLWLERERVLQRWVQRVAAGPLGAARPLVELNGHVTEVFDGLQRALAEAGGAEALIEAARAHGAQRRRLGLELAALAREYGLLRDSILDRVEESSQLITLAEVRALTDLVDQALAESASAHATAESS